MRNGEPNTVTTHRLRRLVVCLSALTIGCGELTAHGQDTGRNTGLQLKLQLSKEQYEAGSSVTLRIEFQNRGSEQIKVGFALQGETGEKLSVQLDILDAAGKKLSPIAQYHLSPYGPHAGRDLFVVLDPRHFYGWEDSLTSWEYPFLGKPGLYQIQVFYEYHPTNEELQHQRSNGQIGGNERKPPIFSGTLHSDPIWLKIVPRTS